MVLVEMKKLSVFKFISLIVLVNIAIYYFFLFMNTFFLI